MKFWLTVILSIIVVSAAVTWLWLQTGATVGQ